MDWNGGMEGESHRELKLLTQKMFLGYGILVKIIFRLQKFLRLTSYLTEDKKFSINQETGTKDWNEWLKQETGTKDWNEGLKQETGTEDWNEGLEPRTEMRDSNKRLEPRTEMRDSNEGRKKKMFLGYTVHV